MHALGLRCTACAWAGERKLAYECPVCGHPLEVFYDYSRVNPAEVERALKAFRTMWDFAELLPVKNRENMITMTEGGTPLIRSRLSLGCRAYWKDETRNPTLSFKDRPNSVGISVAKELGFHEVSIASTGNGGASLSAYAARAGMLCHVCIPSATPGGKVTQQRYHGADITLCDGDYAASFSENKKRSDRNHWVDMTSTYRNPYTMEGDKTIGYEIFAQLGNVVPDWIAVPLGAGAMLTGIYKGFCELKELGFCDRLPKMIGVQAMGCAPIVEAWEKRTDHVDAWKKCDTICGAIADPLTGYEKDGMCTVKSINRSGGVGVKVSDPDTVEAIRNLARTDGLFVEPASATVEAAIRQLTGSGVIRPDEIAVGIITAHGLKDAQELASIIGKEA